MCLALDSDYLWNCCTCSSIEGVFSLLKHSETLSVNVNLYVSHRQFQHLDLNRKLAVPQTGVVLSVLCGQWQCYSELCRCLQCQYLGCRCIFFFNLFGVSLYLSHTALPHICLDVIDLPLYIVSTSQAAMASTCAPLTSCLELSAHRLLSGAASRIMVCREAWALLSVIFRAHVPSGFSFLTTLTHSRHLL